MELIEKNRVRLRGWDYPHLSNKPEQREYGNNWIASWESFRGHCEYWRLYQSAQFIHLFDIREATDPNWANKLKAETISHLRHFRDVDWNKVPGYLSVTNFIYCITEIVEFATRMSQTGVYNGEIKIIIQIKHIAGFVLTTSWNRAWFEYYAASADEIGREWAINTQNLISDSTQTSLDLY